MRPSLASHMCLCGNVQVAEQQGKYLAKQLNIEAWAQKAKDKPPEWTPFKYRHLGSMALVGEAGHPSGYYKPVPGPLLLVHCVAYLSSRPSLLLPTLEVWMSAILLRVCLC